MVWRHVSKATCTALVALMTMGAEGSSCTLSTDVGLAPVQVQPGGSVDAGVEPPEEPDAGQGLGNVVTVSPSVVVLSRGQRFTFEALVTPPPSAEGEQLTNKIVTWSVREGSIGGVVTQSGDTSNGSPKGEYVAGQIPGTYVVRARSDFDPAAIGEATVVVKRVAVSLSPPQATLQPGDTLPFIAHVTGATNTAVAWGIIEGPGTAGIVSNTGKYQANAPGTYHLKATSIEDPTVSAIATITVTSDDLLNIEVCPTDSTIAPGDSLTFTSSSSEVSWAIVPIDGQPTGGAAMTDSTLFAGLTEGSFLVRATSTVDPSKHVDATVRVRVPSTSTVRGRVTYGGAATGRVFVAGEGGWAGTVLADGEGNTRLFRLRGAVADAQPRWLRAWMDTLGTGHYVPHLSPTGLIDLGTGPLPNHQVTIHLDDPTGPPPPPGQLKAPGIHLHAGYGALVCLDPLLDENHEAASAYELEFATDSDFNTVEASVTVSVAGPRCVYQATGTGNRYARARAVRGGHTGTWSATTSLEVPAVDTGAEAVTGSLYFTELPQNPAAVAYVALVPLTAAPDVNPVPQEHWVRLTNLQNPMAFEFQGVEDGRYSVRWAIDFDGDDRLESADLLVPGTEEVTVAGAAVGNLTVNVPAFGALGQVTTHNQAGPGMSVRISAFGFGHQAWQHTVTQLPASLGVHAPLDLFIPSILDRATSLPADDGLRRGATIRLNSMRTRDLNDRVICSHETAITGVLDPVARLWVDASAEDTSMYQPLVRWQPITTQPEAPSVDRYELTLSGPSPGLPKTASRASTDPDQSWSPVATDLSPGIHKLEVTAIDARGNTSTTTSSHAVHASPTGLAIRSNEPAALPTVEWDPPTSTAGILDHVIVVTKANNDGIVARFYAPAIATSARVENPLDPGNYEVTVSRRNAWGQATTSTRLAFAVIAPPTLVRLSNKPIKQPEFTYVHSDTPVAADKLVRTLSGSELEDPITETDQPPSGSIKDFKPGEVTPLSLGTYRWHVRAVDDDGRYADATLEWVVFGASRNLDRTPSRADRPALTWDAPEAPQPATLTYEVDIEKQNENNDWVPVRSKLPALAATSLEISEADQLPKTDSEKVVKHQWRVRAYDELANYAETEFNGLLVFGPPTDPSIEGEPSTLKATAPMFDTSLHGEDLYWHIAVENGAASSDPDENEIAGGETFEWTPPEVPTGSFNFTARVTTKDGKVWMDAQAACSEGTCTVQ